MAKNLNHMGRDTSVYCLYKLHYDSINAASFVSKSKAYKSDNCKCSWLQYQEMGIRSVSEIPFMINYLAPGYCVWALLTAYKLFIIKSSSFLLIRPRLLWRKFFLLFLKYWADRRVATPEYWERDSLLSMMLCSLKINN